MVELVPHSETLPCGSEVNAYIHSKIHVTRSPFFALLTSFSFPLAWCMHAFLDQTTFFVRGSSIQDPKCQHLLHLLQDVQVRLNTFQVALHGNEHFCPSVQLMVPSVPRSSATWFFVSSVSLPILEDMFCALFWKQIDRIQHRGQ